MSVRNRTRANNFGKETIPVYQNRKILKYTKTKSTVVTKMKRSSVSSCRRSASILRSAIYIVAILVVTDILFTEAGNSNRGKFEPKIPLPPEKKPHLSMRLPRLWCISESHLMWGLIGKVSKVWLICHTHCDLQENPISLHSFSFAIFHTHLCVLIWPQEFSADRFPD